MSTTDLDPGDGDPAAAKPVLIEGMIAKLVAQRERFTGAGRRSPVVERLALGAALLLFVGATVLAARGLPDVHADPNYVLLILVGLIGVPAAAFVNAAEYVAAGRALGHRVGTLHAARVSTVATAANLLPIPGAVVVRARALRVLGSQYRKSLAVLGSIGVIWLATTGVLAAAVLLIDRERLGLSLAFVGGGIVAGAGAYALVRMSVGAADAPKWFGWFVLIEIASVVVFAVRFKLTLEGLGFHAAWSQTFTLTIATAAASAVGILPGGLGLREVLAAALAPLVGLPAAVALFAVSVDRIIGLIVLAIISAVLVVIGRSHKEPSDGEAPDGDDVDAHEDDQIPSRLRIVYIGTVPPLPGGISHSGAELTAALRRAGHAVEIVTWAAQYPRALYKGSQRDPDTIAPDGAMVFLRWWAPWSWWRAGRHARGADLLVLPWVTPVQAPAYCVMLGAARRVPRLIVVHNPYPHERRALDDAITRMVLKRADVLLAHSAAAAASTSRLVPDVPVYTAPLPPTLRVEARPLPPRPPFRALFFGMVRPYKGLDIALDALAILRERGIQIELTVAGEFWQPVAPWKKRVAEAGLTDVVDLRPGYVPVEAVSDLLAAHHIVLAPYRSASQSAVVPVACAAGRPTVATPVGGLVEQVRDGENGILATAVEPLAFADAIVRALDDLEALAAGAARVATTWDAVARVVETAGLRITDPQVVTLPAQRVETRSEIARS